MSTKMIRFKLAFNGDTYRFASYPINEELFGAVKAKVASIVGKDAFELFWNDDESNVVMKTASDLAAAVEYATFTKDSSVEHPCVNLVVFSGSSESAATASDQEAAAAAAPIDDDATKLMANAAAEPTRMQLDRALRAQEEEVQKSQAADDEKSLALPATEMTKDQAKHLLEKMANMPFGDMTDAEVTAVAEAKECLGIDSIEETTVMTKEQAKQLLQQLGDKPIGEVTVVEMKALSDAVVCLARANMAARKPDAAVAVLKESQHQVDATVDKKGEEEEEEQVDEIKESEEESDSEESESDDGDDEEENLDEPTPGLWNTLVGAASAILGFAPASRQLPQVEKDGDTEEEEMDDGNAEAAVLSGEAREEKLKMMEADLKKREDAFERRVAEFALKIEVFEEKMKGLDEMVKKVEEGNANDDLEKRMDEMEGRLEKVEERIDDEEIVFL